jgi:hypothetical protein
MEQVMLNLVDAALRAGMGARELRRLFQLSRVEGATYFEVHKGRQSCTGPLTTRSGRTHGEWYISLTALDAWLEKRREQARKLAELNQEVRRLQELKRRLEAARQD